jgi:predicted alpha/beta superfamily hydrolase
MNGTSKLPAHDELARPTKRTLHEVWSAQLGNSRDVDVYLPPSYAEGGRHPVVYMQDGRNLSDPATAFAGTWDLESVLAKLAGAGIDPIVVGVHNTDQRLFEYSPFPDPTRGGGDGDKYLGFLVHTLKPQIDRRFRTRPSAAHTAIAGSSMGGLISLYAWLRHPGVFGLASVMSPALWFGRARLFDFVQSAALPPGRLYLDAGTAEGAAELRDTRELWACLQEKPNPDGAGLRYFEDEGAGHEEEAWGRRLSGALEYLLERPHL